MEFGNKIKLKKKSKRCSGRTEEDNIGTREFNASLKLVYSLVLTGVKA
jgi:hypothetical protein